MSIIDEGCQSRWNLQQLQFIRIRIFNYRNPTMEEQKQRVPEQDKTNKLLHDLNKDSEIEIQFILSEKNWPFVHYSETYKKMDQFLLIENRIKNYHGSIKNLELFYDQGLRKKIEYYFADSLESKLCHFNVNSDLKQPKITLYYRYDNGYEWPLLS